MTGEAERLRSFLDACGAAALVEIADAKGSTPRDKGAWMLVSSDRTFGTIGGGQLEFMAIDKARQMLGALPFNAPMAGMPEDRTSARLCVPLGPEIGQCCGGRVDVEIRLMDEADRAGLMSMAHEEEAALPTVLIFGGGHVGLALASACVLLPVRTTVIESRAEALEGMPAGVETNLVAMPEAVVRCAAAGSVYVILTHDHALDFLIVAEALARDDAAYVGMIGSGTKKATFRNWYLKNGGSEAAFRRLVSPIGGDGVVDKRPAVIAALAAAEIMTALAGHRPARSDQQSGNDRVKTRV